MAYPGFHWRQTYKFISEIYIYRVENLSYLVSCPFEVQCMTILGHKAFYAPFGYAADEFAAAIAATNINVAETNRRQSKTFYSNNT